ncbi:hypothetical protein OF83DRAFT_1072007 [Amylostereum chailletii]|nr:hypothetical protein OF83DRAFT_1072007 [Amylostereum chailletii]
MSNQPIPQAPRLSGFTAGKCLYCSEGHFIRECPYIVMDASAGLIKKNERAQVVLANGMYVPKTIVGPNLRSHIQEWYRQNPSASPSQQPQLMLEVMTQSPVPHTVPSASSVLSAPFKASEPRIEEVTDEDEPWVPVPTSAPVQAPTPLEPTIPESFPLAPMPEHPFANVREATYMPPHTRNVGTAPKPAPVVKKNEPAYRTQPPIRDAKIALDVY